MLLNLEHALELPGGGVNTQLTVRHSPVDSESVGQG